MPKPHLLEIPFSLLFFFFFFLLSLSLPVISQDLNAERSILWDVKQKLGNPSSLWSWNSSSSPCDWPGIFCTNHTVTLISLVGMNITEKIPGTICGLKNVVLLDISYNYIPGEFPDILNCSKLELLYLSTNNFVGPIPVGINRLSSLYALDISYNNFSGNIPATLWHLKKLEVLVLAGNQFTGAWTGGIGNLSNLEYFRVSLNNKLFHSTITKEFGALNKLTSLYMSDANLIGNLPGFFNNLSSLEFLDLSDNGLTGEVLKQLGNCSSLLSLDLSKNSFRGEIPSSNWTSLEFLDLSDNSLSGEVLKQLGNCSSLKFLDLSQNSFWGEIPLGIWTSSNMKVLRLNDNNFSGMLMTRLGQNLEQIQIRNNRFSGPIPAGICSVLSLTQFKASNNMFSGEIPVGLMTLPYISILLLDRNQFSLVSDVSWPQNFSGQLTSDTSAWKTATTLNFSRNNLTGPIPKAITYLPHFFSLDLSENHFSDQIPPELGHLSPKFLNLSSNQLSGKVPDGLQIRRYKSSFLNNPNLCADVPVLDLPSCSKATSTTPHSFSTKYLTLILLFTLFGFLLMVSLMYVILQNYRRKRNLNRNHPETPELIAFQRLDFTKSTILTSLTEDTLIGSGGSGKVHRIAVNDSGEFVVVKRICNNKTTDRNLEKQFLAEVQILGAIRHSNIVKLLCYINSSDNLKLLVYEYMENESLDRWLHKKRGPLPLATSVQVQVQVLDWQRRRQIAIGAAQGLQYMHEHCSPRIIHRDVKSSNILLDSMFNAKIADFGLAKILAKLEDEPETMSAVAGSFGYIAPEYAYTGKANEKIDVYSFGVVLLELATGREANRGNEHMSLAEWAWQHFGDGKSIIEALDEEIMEECYLEEITTVFKLGLMCTRKKPSIRPSMKEVLLILGHCGPQGGT